MLKNFVALRNCKLVKLLHRIYILRGNLKECWCGAVGIGNVLVMSDLEDTFLVKKKKKIVFSLVGMKNEYVKTNLLQWVYFAFDVMACCVNTNRTLILNNFSHFLGKQLLIAVFVFCAEISTEQT